MTPVVLDARVVLWLAGQQDSLSANARGVLADPAVALHVSAIPAWLASTMRSAQASLGCFRAPGVQGSKVANNTEPSRRSSRCLRSSSVYSAWSPWRSSPRNAVSSVPSGFTRTAPTNGLAREYDPFILLGQFSFASPEFYVSHGGSPHTG